jgi:hypothetical protein
MGIIADTANYDLSLTDPPGGWVDMNMVGNYFTCFQQHAELTFGLKFDTNPRNGVGGTAPSTPPFQNWEIGIVQNVLFEMYNFEYENHLTFTKTFPTQVLDSVAQIHQGFYSDPYALSFCVPGGVKCSTQAVRAAEDIVISATGYDYFTDPFTNTASGNKPSSLTMVDDPRFSSKLRFGTSTILRAESITAFQVWLVARRGPAASPAALSVLASLGPFSIVMSMTTQGSTGSLLSTPSYSVQAYAQTGISRAVNRSPNFSPGVKLSIQAGSGGTAPIMTGTTANMRALAWLNQNGLLPLLP